MDGHKCVYVVEYQNKVFLPVTAKFERRMAQHTSPELKKIMSEPIKGQRHIIIQYHDESCFYANDDA
jgi:predicted GIY-YIG superfamily endonuclease